MSSNKSGRILVTAKVNPDLDGVSCTLAYADLLDRTGKKSDGIIFGSPQSETQYFIENHNIEIPTQPDKAFNKWSKYVLVDASSMKGMPKSVVASKVIEIIDHRKSEPEKDFPKAKIQNDLIGAAATIVVERFRKAGVKPSKDHAELMYGAIYHNTLNFIASNATARDREAAEYLEKEYKLNQNLIRGMFDYATVQIEADVKQALEDDAKEFGPGYKIGAYQLVVWGSGVRNRSDEVEEGVGSLSKKLRAEWAFLNLIDLESKKSNIFCRSKEGRVILSKAVGCKFKDGWCELDKAWLRKQIMPKVNEVVGN